MKHKHFQLRNTGCAVHYSLESNELDRLRKLSAKIDRFKDYDNNQVDNLLAFNYIQREANGSRIIG